MEVALGFERRTEKLDFEADAAFESLAGQMFDRALRRMTGAFEARAAQLYGISSSSAQTAA